MLHGYMRLRRHRNHPNPRDAVPNNASEVGSGTGAVVVEKAFSNMDASALPAVPEELSCSLTIDRLATGARVRT